MVFTKTRINYGTSFRVETLVFLWQRFSGSPYTKKLKSSQAHLPGPLQADSTHSLAFHLLVVHLVLWHRERCLGSEAEPSSAAGGIVGESHRLEPAVVRQHSGLQGGFLTGSSLTLVVRSGSGAYSSAAVSWLLAEAVAPVAAQFWGEIFLGIFPFGSSNNSVSYIYSLLSSFISTLGHSRLHCL